MRTGKVRIYQRRYGQSFRAYRKRDPGWADDVYQVNIKGQGLTLSSEQYVEIHNGRQIIFLGTHHQGATFFTAIAHRRKLVVGDEDFFHIDRASHPDNSDTELLYTTPPLSASLRTHLEYLSSLELREGNYMNAVAATFPGMRLVFLHERHGVTADWGGMQFSHTGSIFDYDQTINNGVASVDLDLFHTFRGFGFDPQRPMLADRYPGEQREGELHMQRLLEIARSCKVAMFFVSETHYLSPVSRAEEIAEQAIEGMLVT